jgi:hypothetical protein
VTTLKTLEIWTAQSICNAGIVLSFVSFLLHVARPYFESVLSKLKIRMAADLWWLGYVILRDGTLFVASVIGLWTLNLDLMADIKIGLPFVPAGTVLLCAALLWKVFRGGDSTRPVMMLVTAGALLNAIGYVLVMEAPGNEYVVAQTPFWKTMVSLRSNANPGLATATFYAALTIIGVMTIAATIASFRRVREPR